MALQCVQLMDTVDVTRPAFFLLEEVVNFLVTRVPMSRGGGQRTVRAVWAVLLPLLDLGYQVRGCPSCLCLLSQHTRLSSWAAPLLCASGWAVC